MKSFGILLVIAGIVWALIAFNIDTSVSTAYGSVNNIGLIAARNNNLMFAGLTILIGVVLIGFGSNRKNEALSHDLKACPFCAEKIQPSALKCRFCNADLPDSFRTPAANEIHFDGKHYIVGPLKFTSIKHAQEEANKIKRRNKNI